MPRGGSGSPPSPGYEREAICSQPFKGLSGLAVGLRVKGSPMQPSLILKLSISPPPLQPCYTAMLPHRDALEEILMDT